MAIDSGALVRKFLIKYAKNSPFFAHQLIWKSRVESVIELSED